MRRAMPVEVRPEGDRGPSRRYVSNSSKNRARCDVVLAEGEGLLELIDDQKVVVEHPRGYATPSTGFAPGVISAVFDTPGTSPLSMPAMTPARHK